MISKEINLYDLVKVIEDSPGTSIKKNMVAVIIYVYKPGKIFELEFITDNGSTFCLETFEASAIEKIPDKLKNDFNKLYVDLS